MEIEKEMEEFAEKESTKTRDIIERESKTSNTRETLRNNGKIPVHKRLQPDRRNTSRRPQQPVTRDTTMDVHNRKQWRHQDNSGQGVGRMAEC